MMSRSPPRGCPFADHLVQKTLQLYPPQLEPCAGVDKEFRGTEGREAQGGLELAMQAEEVGIVVLAPREDATVILQYHGVLDTPGKRALLARDLSVQNHMKF